MKIVLDRSELDIERDGLPSGREYMYMIVVQWNKINRMDDYRIFEDTGNCGRSRELADLLRMVVCSMKEA